MLARWLKSRSIVGVILVFILTTTAFWFLPLIASNVDKSNYSVYSVPLTERYIYHTNRIGDLNSDGLDDIALACDQSLEILFQSPVGEFASTVTLLEGYTNGEFVLADLDGDGSLDICCPNGTSTFVVALNDGSGTNWNFSAIDLEDVYIRAIFPLWLGNKAIPDVVLVALGKQTTVSIYSNDGAGNLELNTSVLCSKGVIAVSTGNFNNDSTKEIVLLQKDGNLTFFSIDPPTITSQQLNISRWIRAEHGAWLLPIDLNGDSADDLVIAANDVANRGDLLFLQLNGTDILEEPFLWSFGTSFLGANSADLDIDLDNDIILTTLDGQTLLIENEMVGVPSRYMLLPSLALPSAPGMVKLTGIDHPAVVVLSQIETRLYDNHKKMTVFSRDSGVLNESVWFASQSVDRMPLMVGQTVSVVSGLLLVIVVSRKFAKPTMSSEK